VVEPPGSARAESDPVGSAPVGSDPVGSGQQVGWREVVIVAVVVVGAVLGLGLVATLVPAVGDVFNRQPIAILVLVVGTAWILWQITRRDERR
jgi:hypothetical protein